MSSLGWFILGMVVGSGYCGLGVTLVVALVARRKNKCFICQQYFFPTPTPAPDSTEGP